MSTTKILSVPRNALDTIQPFHRMFLYGVIGLTALALEIAVFYMLAEKLGFNIALGNAAGMFAGLLFGFTMNAHYNFKVHDHRFIRLARYGLVALGGYMLTTSIIFGLTHFLELASFTAKLLSLPPYFLFQYNCNRLFTFRHGISEN